jgi:hypothetical protein
MEVYIMKRNLLIPLLILGLGFSSTTHPMAWVAAHFTKESLKKIIEKGATGLHLGIAAGPFLVDIANQLIVCEKIKKNIQDGKSYSGRTYSKEELEENKKHQEWIRQELKSLGYSNWEKVVLVPCLAFAAAGDFKTQLLFYDKFKVSDAYNEQNAFYKKLSLLNWISKPFETEYNELRGSLSHEISHLKNHDTEKALTIGFATPFIIYLGSKKIMSLANLAISNFALRNGLKIISGFGNLVVSKLSEWGYSNFSEKNADENVPNDIEILKGSARKFKKYAELEKKYADEIHEINLSWYERLIKLPDTHEDHSKRAQRFEERLAQLKKSKVSK